MSELADLVSRISGNLKYWFAHILVKDSAIVDQNISFSWLVSVLMISIPFPVLGCCGSR